MGTFSPNILLNEPTPLDPATLDAWGTTVNTNFTLIDSAVAGILSLSVAGNSNVILTSTSGVADQSRNQGFKFTGTLTGDINVLWPNGLNRFFSVTNSTTGAFTLALAVNDGSGSPAGSTYTIAQGETSQFQSDGTNITIRGVSVDAVPSGTVLGSFLQATAPAGWTQNNTFNDAVIRLVDDTGTGGATGGSWTIDGVTIGGTAITQAQLPNVSFTVSDPTHAHSISDPTHEHNSEVSNFIADSGSGANEGTGPLAWGSQPHTAAAATGITINAAATGISVSSGGSGATHTHTFTEDGTWRPAYVNSIVCQKN